MNPDLDAILEAVTRQVALANPAQKAPAWSDEEIRFLHENVGRLNDEEIAKTLGRTPNAVKVYRVRQGLSTLSRARMDWFTANQVASVIGSDIHKLSHWCRVGLIPSLRKVHEPSGREYFLISREHLKRWCVNPLNWVYFDWRQVTDEPIRRLCELRAQRWGDSWWTTNQVAEYHGVTNKDVTRYIKAGKLKAHRPEHCLGGRDFKDTWRYYFVLESEATRPDLFFVRKADIYKIAPSFTPRADAFLLKARNEMGKRWADIARMMKRDDQSIRNRYRRLEALNTNREERKTEGSQQHHAKTTYSPARGIFTNGDRVRQKPGSQRQGHLCHAKRAGLGAV